MIIRCKNTYGDGTVEYVDYEVEEFVPEEGGDSTQPGDDVDAG